MRQQVIRYPHPRSVSSRWARSSRPCGRAGRRRGCAPRRIEGEVVELLARAGALRPRAAEVLARAVVDVRQHREVTCPVAAVLVPARPHRALPVVGGVEGQLGVDLVVGARAFAAHERQQRAALEMVRRRDPGRLGSLGTGRSGRPKPSLTRPPWKPPAPPAAARPARDR